MCHDLQPDLTILMVSDVARTVARARRRNVEQSKRMADDENRFEKENRAFYNRVLAAYMAIARRAPQRVIPVDAADPIAVVQKRIVPDRGRAPVFRAALNAASHIRASSRYKKEARLSRASIQDERGIRMAPGRIAGLSSYDKKMPIVLRVDPSVPSMEAGV